MGKRANRGAATHFQFLDEDWLLKGLWPDLERFVNGHEPPIDFNAIRHDPAVDPEQAIGRMVDDAEEIDGVLWNEIRGLLSSLLRGGIAPGNLEAGKARLALTRSGWIWLRADSQRQRKDDFYFTIKLLELPALRHRLRQCDRCGRFFLGARAHVRAHSFCSSACRFAFHRGTRTREAHAKYMRDYRKVKAKRGRQAKLAGGKRK